MALFDQSTHVNNWLMDQSFRVKARLTAIRNYQSNKNSVTALERVSSCSTFDERMEFSAPTATEQVTLKQEDVIIRHFSEIMQEMVGPVNPAKGTTPHFQKSWRMQATAMVYFQRFYLFNSLSVFDPRQVMLASIFLAGKTEQQFMAPAELISMKGAHCSAAQLMHVELVLLEGLNFDLKVFHPHNLCALIINQALEVSADEANSDDKARFEQEVLQQQIREGNVVNSEAMAVQSGADDVSTAFKKAWRDTALIHIAELMVVSVSLHYSPAIIATFALQLALTTMRTGLTTELQLLGLHHLTVSLKLWMFYTNEQNSEFSDTVDEIADWFLHEAMPIRSVEKETIRKQFLSKLKAGAYWNLATASVKREP